MHSIASQSNTPVLRMRTFGAFSLSWNGQRIDILSRATGFQDVTRKIKVPASSTATLHLKLSRIFTPDTELDTTHGVFRGVLVSNTDAGLILKTKPGVEQTFRHEDIRKIVPLLND